jgi:hypothetical protein
VAEGQAFSYGNQKINLHVQGSEFEPKAHLPVPGSLDLCFIASIPLESVMQRLNEQHWPIVGGACYAHWRKTEDSIGLRSRSGFQPH